MTHTRYPKAEQWLRRYRLPMTECSVTRNLYGYHSPRVDMARVRRDALMAGHRGDALSWILGVVEEESAYLEA